MERIILWIQKQNRVVYHVFLLVLASLIVLQFLPREAQFKYEFEKGKPWMHEDLIAPFDFPVQKTSQELENELTTLTLNKEYFFDLDSAVAEIQVPFFRDRVINNILKDTSIATIDSLALDAAADFLRNQFLKGIIEIPSAVEQREDKTIFITI